MRALLAWPLLGLAGGVACGARSPLDLAGGSPAPADAAACCDAATPPDAGPAEDAPGAPGDSATAPDVGLTGCTVVQTPTILATLPCDALAGVGLAVAGSNLYVAADALDATCTSQIFRVPVTGGAAEVFVASDYSFGRIVADATTLYFPRYVPGAHGGDYAGLVEAQPLDGSPSFILQNPPASDAGPSAVLDVEPQPGAGVLVLLEKDAFDFPSAGTDVVSWLGPGGTAIVLGTIPPSPYVYELAQSGTSVFAMGNYVLDSVPVGGGAPTPPHRLPAPEGGSPGNGVPSILASNASALFLTLDGQTIVRLDATSGAQSVLASGAALDIAPDVYRVPAWADDASLYYAAGGQLLGVPAGGGASEVVWDGHGRWFIQAIAADACTVYWTGYDVQASVQRVLAAPRR